MALDDTVEYPIAGALPDLAPSDDPETLRAVRQQVRTARAALKELTRAVSLACAQLDQVMTHPESQARGKRVAAIVNALDLANDRALHFALTQSFAVIAREKKRLKALENL
jgi:hypothetical protein